MACFLYRQTLFSKKLVSIFYCNIPIMVSHYPIIDLNLVPGLINMAAKTSYHPLVYQWYLCPIGFLDHIIMWVKDMVWIPMVNKLTLRTTLPLYHLTSMFLSTAMLEYDLIGQEIVILNKFIIQLLYRILLMKSGIMFWDAMSVYLIIWRLVISRQLSIRKDIGHVIFEWFNDLVQLSLKITQLLSFVWEKSLL